MPVKSLSTRGLGQISENVIQRGHVGAAVRRAQLMLKSLGYDLGPAGVDGIFGPDTEEAVRRFQRLQPELVDDGIIGPNTWELLFLLVDNPARFRNGNSAGGGSRGSGMPPALEAGIDWATVLTVAGVASLVSIPLLMANSETQK